MHFKSSENCTKLRGLLRTYDGLDVQDSCESVLSLLRSVALRYGMYKASGGDRTFDDTFDGMKDVLHDFDKYVLLGYAIGCHVRSIALKSFRAIDSQPSLCDEVKPCAFKYALSKIDDMGRASFDVDFVLTNCADVKWVHGKKVLDFTLLHPDVLDLNSNSYLKIVTSEAFRMTFDYVMSLLFSCFEKVYGVQFVNEARKYSVAYVDEARCALEDAERIKQVITSRTTSSLFA